MALEIHDRQRPQGGLVRTLLLARPEKRNALDVAHLSQLGTALDAAGREPNVRVVVVAAQGKSFCAGYDLSQPFEAEAPDALVVKTMAAVRSFPRPTIARVEGAAFGAGLELAISCDFRLATCGASFCLPPAKLGIAYAPEGLARLIALVGVARAKSLAFTGRVVDAGEAKEMNLVDELLEGEAAMTARLSGLGDQLADVAPNAVALMKRTFAALEPSLSAAERAVLESERIALFGSEDAAEGLAAFAARRPPLFRGR